jgi:small subunit ribosomal protein S5
MAQENQGNLIDKLVKVKRCAAVVKGGRRFSFAAMVVVGDGRGKVGWGYGKANEVPPAVEKATKQASRSLVTTAVVDGSIPHKVTGTYGAAQVVLLPAGAGTGVIAGGPVRAVLEAVGITDVLTKSQGSNNPINVARATMNGLEQLITPERAARERGISVEELGLGARRG